MSVVVGYLDSSATHELICRHAKRPEIQLHNARGVALDSPWLSASHEGRACAYFMTSETRGIKWAWVCQTPEGFL